MSQVLHPHECDCSCGHNGTVHHIIACCDLCPTCNKRIKTYYLDDHKKECREFYAELCDTLNKAAGFNINKSDK